MTLITYRQLGLLARVFNFDIKYNQGEIAKKSGQNFLF